MVKKKEETVEEVLKKLPDDTVIEIPSLNDLALGVAKDVETGVWHLVEIPFDLKTGIVGPATKSGEGDLRAIIIERFKISAATKLDIG